MCTWCGGGVTVKRDRHIVTAGLHVRGVRARAAHDLGSGVRGEGFGRMWVRYEGMCVGVG